VPYMFLVPFGNAYDILPFTSFLQAATFFPCIEGLPGQDAGYVGVRFIDATGAPMAGTPVTFTVARGNGTTLGNAPVQSVGYKTTACTVASSGVSSACQTDQYGVAYAEVLLSSQVGASPSITARGGGTSFAFGGSNCPAAVIAKPSVSSITDASSGGSSAVAGSYIAINGTALANPAFISAPNGIGDYAQFPPMPLGLDGVNVSFDVPGSYDGKQIDYNGQPGPVEFVSIDAATVLVQVPWELQGTSSVQVKAAVDGFAFSNVITVPLVQYAPSVFPNPDGSGIAHAYDVTTDSEVDASHPVHAGDVVELFANGLGPVNNQPPSGGDLPAAPTFAGGNGQPGTVAFSGKEATTTTTPTVTVGGQPATVTFSGLDYSLGDSPYYFQYGVYIKMPTGLTAGSQPVVLSIGGVTASPLPIPVK
jgi:uncharacterized protein (TIGR03437 family)